MADTKKIREQKINKNVGVDTYETIQKSDPNYSSIALGTMNSDNIYEVPATSNTGSEFKIGEDVKKEEDIKRSKKLIYLVAMLVSIVMLLAVSLHCFLKWLNFSQNCHLSRRHLLSKHPSSCAIYSRSM